MKAAAAIRTATLLALLQPFLAAAQDSNPAEAESSVSVTGLARPRANLDGGGSFDTNSIRASATLGRRLAPDVSASIGFKYAYEDWHFTTPGALGPVAPWNAIQAPSIEMNLSYRFSKQLEFFVAPQVGWTYETGASSGDAVSYGAVLGLTYIHSPALVLGLGASAFRQIDQTRLIPFVIVNWQITEQWRLTNPLNAGPTGGPGVELGYSINDQWDVGLGAVFRETRFRLRSDGPVPNGIGVDKGIPIFARLTYQVSQPISIDFYAGVIVEGELRVLNSNGATLSSSDYKPSPIFAISAKYEF